MKEVSLLMAKSIIDALDLEMEEDVWISKVVFEGILKSANVVASTKHLYALQVLYFTSEASLAIKFIPEILAPLLNHLLTTIFPTASSHTLA